MNTLLTPTWFAMAACRLATLAGMYRSVTIVDSVAPTITATVQDSSLTSEWDGPLVLALDCLRMATVHPEAAQRVIIERLYPLMNDMACDVLLGKAA